MKKKWAKGLLILSLCLALLFPQPVAAADVCFTAVNDWLSPLTADTMPVWFGGALYVPYTIFDGSYTGINLGFYCSYSREEGTIALYNIGSTLIFDLNAGTCRDDTSGTEFPARAIMRHGRPYLPVGMVCSFFGLASSYYTISQGSLVRIKSNVVVMSDSRFVDAAGNLLNRYLREYNQSIAPAPDPPATTPSTPPTTVPESPSTVRTYLALRCDTAEQLSAALGALDGTGRYALLLLPPHLIGEEGDLVRRTLGSGHSLGILAEGERLEDTRDLLERGCHMLEQVAHTRTTLAMVPGSQRNTLESEGWVCWNETLSLTPSSSVGASAFASSTLRRLEGRTRTTFLTLRGDDTARVLPTLLRQLANRNFVVSIPMETEL